MTGPDPSPFTPVTPGDRGQDSRTAAEDGAAVAPTRGRAPQARARAGQIVAALSPITQRVGQSVSRNREPGEGTRVWIEGASSPADVVDRIKAGPVAAGVPGAAEWPQAQVVAWKVAMAVLVLPVVAIANGLVFACDGVLRVLATLILVALLVITSAAGDDDEPAGPAPAPAVTVGGER